MTAYLDMIITGLISLFVGGGAIRFYMARQEKELVKAQAKSLGVKTEAEVHDLSVATLIKANEHLQQQYQNLRVEIGEVKEERDSYWEQMERMREEMQDLRDQLEQTQKDLETAHAATIHLQRQLENLMATMPEFDGKPQSPNSRKIAQWAAEHKDDPRRR